MENGSECARTSSTRFTTDIKFKNVSFGYDDNRLILDNFNFTLNKGNRYLIKGPSGCGKTTVVNLLLGYYGVLGGKIEIDGASVGQTANPYSWMTVVRQEPVLFRDTLWNNLTMYQDIPKERVVEVLKKVGLEKFADTETLNSTVYENGTDFSGGEKKRICLARALLKDTDMLILDEPLANLDSETAALIEDLLLSIQNKTIIIVSHQFTEHKLNSFNQVVELCR